MARVSITKAAKLAGVARSHFYKAYIDTGVVSLSKDEKSKPYIDTSELLRVFGTLTEDPPRTGHRTPVEDKTGQSEKVVEDNPFEHLEEIRSLKLQLEEAKEREGWYQSQITHLTDSIKLLEAPKQTEHSPELKSLLKALSAPKHWWQFWK